MDYYLLRKGNHANPLRINLDKNEVTVGRNFFPDLHNSVHVSREHASFKLSSDSEWFVADLKSLNGVYVNGVRVTQPLHRLRLGDTIGLGVIHATTDDSFEFELCRVNVKKELKEDEVIVLNDSETLSTGRCNQNQNSYQQENVQNLVNKPMDNAQVQNESVSSKSYADIINGKQPVVVLTRCDSGLFFNSKNTLQKKKPLKSRKRIIISESTSSSDYEELDSSHKKRKLSFDKQNFCNVYSSDSSDEDSFFKSIPHVPKNITTNMKHGNDKNDTINKLAHNELLSIAKNYELSHSSNSNDIENGLAEFGKGISSQNKSSHCVNKDNGDKNGSKETQPKPSTVMEEKRNVDSFVCESSHSITNQPFVFRQVKVEKDLDDKEKTQFNSTTFKIKTEVPAVAIKIEINQEEESNSLEADVLGYSQMDEVIVISDNDDYLSFPPSQEKCAENMLNIKVEPIDGDDLDSDGCVDKNKEKLYNASVYNDLTSDAREEHEVSTKINLEVQSEEPYSENIDTIKDFLKKNCIPSKNETTKINLKLEAANEDNDFFPILSQNFYAEDKPHSSKKLQENSNEDNLPSNNTDKLRIDFSKFEKNKHTTALFIEPQPMKYRPRYQRGREEWFDDGYFEKNDNKSKDQLIVKSSDTLKKQKSVKESLIQSNSKIHSTKKKMSIKEKIKEKMGHRICTPNGGPAIPLTSNQPRIYSSEISSTKQISIATKMPISSNKYFTATCHKKNKIISKDNIKNKVRFKSRVELLSETPVEIKKNSKKIKVVEYKIPKINSNSNCSSSLNHEISSVEQNCHKKVGENLINKQKPINVNLTTNKLNKQAEKGKSEKLPSQSEFPFSDLMQQPSNFIKTMLTTNLKEFEKETCQEPDHAKANGLIINNSCQIRDPRMRSQSILNKERNTTPVQKMCIVKPNNNQIPSQLSSEKQAFEKPVRLDFDSVLSVVLHWNPSWLKEYKIISRPPHCITKDLKSLPSSFKSFGEYTRRFYPVILLELWEYIFKEYNEIECASNGRHEVNAICIMVTECISKGDIMVLNCESLVNMNSAFYPREGNLVIVDLFEEAHSNQVFKVFGFVSNHRVEKLDFCHLHREFHRRPEAKLDNSVLYKFSLKTKKLRLKLALEKLTKACVLCYVANKIRLADGLQYLLTSPLRHTILQPSEKTLTCQSKNVPLPQSLYGNYNQMQTSAIINIAEEMKEAYFKCKMLLLQGPPGTGKTHTIIGLIQNLILDKNIKILVTAPSNAAVDEIGKRLIRLKKSCPDKNVRIVRVGLDKQIHRDLLPYTLKNITLQYASRSTKYELEHLKKTLNEKDEVIKQLKKEISSKSRTGILTNEIGQIKSKLMMETRRKQSLIEEIERVKRTSINFYDPAIYMDKVVVLEKANIILSTLGSCRLKILEKVFGEKSKTHFTCCIVDEAAQCTEPEIMQLLVFGLSKFVLVGDHKQLPATVYSKLAIQMNYNISLFERIHAYFQKQHLPSPMLALTEQYRMHSEICSFPSAHFYSNKLYTAPNLDKKFISFPLKPFIILNINDSQESNIQSSKKNFPEAETIVHICEQLHRMHDFNKYSVGIITPYQGQKDLVLHSFKEKRYYNHIEVNTIDSFQGREKDIIILSCVRARSQDGNIGFLECNKRLNVAITRARQCLIICGHMNSLHNHADWKSLIANSKKRQLYITVTSNKDIPFVMEEIKRQK